MVQEYGFYHPDRGYWQTTNQPPQDILDSYPEGTVPYPLPPGPYHIPKEGGWEFTGSPSLPLTPLTPIDFMLGMLTLNVTPDQVDALIDQLPEPDRMMSRIYWTRAREFVREDPLIDEIAAAFNKTPEDIDGAWRYAMGLQSKAT